MGEQPEFGRYRVIGRIGEGGMGTVLLGLDPDGRKVAIKVVRPDFANDAEFRDRFRSEVNRARQVPPFCTAEVLDADPAHDPPYLVVEYVDGPSLAAAVKTDGPLTEASLHSVAIGIATALTAIHGAAVIHRDLKPANVLMASGGIKVIDFGIARAFEATSKHTRTDQMVGTVAYMAPERFDPSHGRPVTPAADIFAWGAVVAYAATGRTPFETDSPPATAMRILTQPPSLEGIPASLRDVVAWALEKEPQDRPTARELLDVLVSARPVARPVPGSPLPPVSGSPPTPVSGSPLPPLSGSPPPLARSVSGSPLPPGRSVPGSSLPPATPPPTDAPVEVPDRPRGRTRVRALAVAGTLAALVLAGGIVLLRNNAGEVTPAAQPSGQPSGQASARPSTGTPAPVDTYASILRGNRRILIHVDEINRDLALDLSDSEVSASNGVGTKSLFALEQYGVDYMIRTLRDGKSDGETCLGVRIVPDGPSSLVPVECTPTKATVFELSPTGKKDDKGRPTHWMYNDAYGFVQYSPTDKAIFVQEVGDAEPLSSFSFVDRGAL